MILSTIGVLAAAAAISKAADKSSKKANPKLNNEEFDARCARLGINRVKIMDVAARCGVYPSKYGVLPENGWMQCINYAAKYANSEEDIEIFKNNWRYAVKRQLEGKSQQMIDKYWDSYQTMHQAFLEYKDYWTSGPIITLEIKHWHGMPKEEHIARMEDIQENTFWGELVHRKPILRHNPRIKDAHIETWILRGKENDRQDSRFAMKQQRYLYKVCCGVCGYDAML